MSAFLRTPEQHSTHCQLTSESRICLDQGCNRADEMLKCVTTVAKGRERDLLSGNVRAYVAVGQGAVHVGRPGLQQVGEPERQVPDGDNLETTILRGLPVTFYMFVISR